MGKSKHLGSMIFHHEIIAVPFELWLVATIMFVAKPLLTWLMFRTTIKPSAWEMFGQSIAGKALSPVIHYAALRTTLTGNAKWTRTSKFKAKHSYIAALISTKEEILVGLSLAAFIIVAYAEFPYTGMSLMLLIGLFYVTVSYFAAPLMSLIGVYSTRHPAVSRHRTNLVASNPAVRESGSSRGSRQPQESRFLLDDVRRGQLTGDRPRNVRVGCCLSLG